MPHAILFFWGRLSESDVYWGRIGWVVVTITHTPACTSKWQGGFLRPEWSAVIIENMADRVGSDDAIGCIRETAQIIRLRGGADAGNREGSITGHFFGASVIRRRLSSHVACTFSPPRKNSKKKNSVPNLPHSPTGVWVCTQSESRWRCCSLTTLGACLYV